VTPKAWVGLPSSGGFGTRKRFGLLGPLDNGLGFYRLSYTGSQQTHAGDGAGDASDCAGGGGARPDEKSISADVAE
jgi:hypothetical protein